MSEGQAKLLQIKPCKLVENKGVATAVETNRVRQHFASLCGPCKLDKNKGVATACGNEPESTTLRLPGSTHSKKNSGVSEHAYEECFGKFTALAGYYSGNAYYALDILVTKSRNADIKFNEE